MVISVSDENFNNDRRIRRRRIDDGARIIWIRSGFAADSRLERQFHSAGGVTVSARKLAAALWQLGGATTCGIGGSRRKCGLFDPLRVENDKDMEKNAAWKTRQHKKTSEISQSFKDSIKRERKHNKKMEILNSKILNQITEAKLSVRKLMQRIEKEKRVRKLLEGTCIELAKETESNKAEIQALKNRFVKLEAEVEKERKMLRITDVSREERARMKLNEAKLIFQDRYDHINKLIADLETFLESSNSGMDPNKLTNAKSFRNVFNIQETKAFAKVKDSHQKEKVSSLFKGEFQGINEEVCKRILMEWKGMQLPNGSIRSSAISWPLKLQRSSALDLVGKWNQRPKSNPHIVRAMKGHVEWPRGIRS